MQILHGMFSPLLERRCWCMDFQSRKTRTSTWIKSKEETESLARATQATQSPPSSKAMDGTMVTSHVYCVLSLHQYVITVIQHRKKQPAIINLDPACVSLFLFKLTFNPTLCFHAKNGSQCTFTIPRPFIQLQLDSFWKKHRNTENSTTLTDMEKRETWKTLKQWKHTANQSMILFGSTIIK